MAEIQKKLKEEESLANTMKELARLSERSDELPSMGRDKKSTGGGIKQTWKKLREKRAKKRSITGPEFPISISEIMGTKRQSPAIPEESTVEKDSKVKSDGKEKVHTSKKPKEPKKKSTESKEGTHSSAQPDTLVDENPKSTEVKTDEELRAVSSPPNPRKETTAELGLPESLSNPKLSQSASFSSSTNTQGSDNQGNDEWLLAQRSTRFVFMAVACHNVSVQRRMFI